MARLSTDSSSAARIDTAGTIGKLKGKKILITRPIAQSQGFVELLQAAGAIPVEFPTIEIMPIPENAQLDAALHTLRHYDWVIFTSTNGVSIVLAAMSSYSIPPDELNQVKVAVIGPATAQALQNNGIHVNLQPERYIAEAIFDALKGHGEISGKKFLLLRADIARSTLREQLKAHGAVVDEIPVYSTTLGNPAPSAYEQVRAGVDIITFTSSSTVRNFFELLGSEALSLAQRAVIACIGPITAQTAREYGLSVALVADEYTIPGLVTALSEYTAREV